MRILFFSALLAVAVANSIPQDDSVDGQKDGMCYEEYKKKHPEEFEKITKMLTDPSEESTNPAAPNGGPPKHKEGQANHHEEDGHHPHGKPRPLHLLKYSNLRKCSLDKDCDGKEKCCWTMSEKRCTEPIFEKKVEEPEHDVPGKNDDKKGGKDGEEMTGRKRHASDENEDNNDEKAGGGAGKGKGGRGGKGGERGNGGVRGKGRGRGKGCEKGKGHGKRKGREEQGWGTGGKPEVDVPVKPKSEQGEADGKQVTRQKHHASEEEADGGSGKGGEKGNGRGQGKGGEKGKGKEKGKGRENGKKREKVKGVEKGKGGGRRGEGGEK